jgi:protein-L-isoaspartate(D-aspartate) O-methyltransferase
MSLGGPVRQRRHAYAAELAALGGIGDQAVLRAFATVPREAFLPAGPWLIEAIDGSCYRTEDTDTDRILHGVGVVLDAQRTLHCANPARVGRAIQATEFRRGQTVLHVGAGLGYFSAVMAELVGPEGRVIAAEIDADLASQARRNLMPWSNVEVVGDALSLDLPELDVIFASCGMATIPRKWLDALRADGRMTFPLTGELWLGEQFSVQRRGNTPWFDAKALGGVVFYPCMGLQDKVYAAALKAALMKGCTSAVRGLRTDKHAAGAECWLHGDGWCLTTAEPIS